MLFNSSFIYLREGVISVCKKIFQKKMFKKAEVFGQARNYDIQNLGFRFKFNNYILTFGI